MEEGLTLAEASLVSRTVVHGNGTTSVRSRRDRRGAEQPNREVVRISCNGLQHVRPPARGIPHTKVAGSAGAMIATSGFRSNRSPHESRIKTLQCC
jgi:hypothetical protein